MKEIHGNPGRRNYAEHATRIAGAIVLVLLAWYLYNNREVLTLLRNISWQQILLIVLLEAASFLLNSAMDQSMINRLDPRVRFVDCYLLQYANNFLNKVLPTIGGGAAFRAIYLKRKYGFPYSKFVSTIAGLYVISFATVSLIGILSLFAIRARYGIFSWIIFAAFLGLLLGCLLVMLLAPRVPEGNAWVLRLLRSVVEGWNIIRQDWGFVLRYTLFAILALGLSAAQTFIIYTALGTRTDPLSMLFLSTLGIILAFLNFTPDGIGVREGAYAFSTSLVRIPSDVLILGSLVLRAISMSTTFIIGGVSYFVLMRQLRVLEGVRIKRGT